MAIQSASCWINAEAQLRFEFRIRRIKQGAILSGANFAKRPTTGFHWPCYPATAQKGDQISVRKHRLWRPDSHCCEESRSACGSSGVPAFSDEQCTESEGCRI